MKILLDKKFILNLSSNMEVYRTGEKIFLDGDIENMEISDRNKCDFFDFKLSGNIGVELLFEKNGGMISHKCTCSPSSIWRGACKHVVGCLFYLDAKMESIILSEKEERLSKELTNIYKNKMIKNINVKSFVKGEKVSITPKLNVISGSKTALSFMIGTKRKYILKDIYDFMDDLKNNATVSYGRELEFTHTYDSFDAQSIKLINFIEKYCVSSTSRYLDRSDAKSINLNTFMLDEFFELYENFKIDINFDDKDRVCLVDNLGRHMDFGADVSVNDGKIILKFLKTPLAVMKGLEFDYYIVGKAVVSTPKDISNFLKDFFDAMEDYQMEELTFFGESAYFFKAVILKKLADFDLIDKETENLVKAYFTEYVPRFYFDVLNKNVLCTVAIYDNKNEAVLLDEKNPFLESLNNFILELLTKYGFLKGRESFYKLSVKDNIFNFYKNGLKELGYVGEVYITKELEELAYIPEKSEVKFDAKISGNLLELQVDSLNYSIEELVETLKNYDAHGYHELKSGKFIDLDDRNIREAREFLMDMDVSFDDISDTDNNKILLPKYRAFKIEDKDNFIIDESVEKLLDDVKKFVEVEFDLPKSLNDVLRDYQKKGFKWLKTLDFYGLGGVLADDMGLGKTLQSISLILSEKESGNEKSSLIVCPKSLIYNWKNEIEKFAENLKCCIVAGSVEKREKSLQEEGIDVFITTYDSLKRDIANYKKIEFKFIILDEAQNIKNHKTQNARAIKKLKSENKFALTGTPIENSLDELWSIFDFIMPNYLNGYSKFMKEYNNPIVRDDDKDRLLKLKSQIRPFILRRNKKDVLKELPEKIETVHVAEMTEEQEKLYSAFLLEARGEINELSKTNSNDRMKVLTLITRLRQICCDPSMFIENYKGGSGKLFDALEIIKQSIENGHRILLFSQFTRMLGILKTKLEKENIEYFYLDGALNSKDRISFVDRFNGGEREVFLISLKAGGSGLNLTGADVVIHFDPWWNYSVMNQATDRAHRIGQEKVVQVINIVAENSIEEKIMTLQKKKQNLIENVLEDNSSFINKMSYNEILTLFED